MFEGLAALVLNRPRGLVGDRDCRARGTPRWESSRGAVDAISARNESSMVVATHREKMDAMAVASEGQADKPEV